MYATFVLFVLQHERTQPLVHANRYHLQLIAVQVVDRLEVLEVYQNFFLCHFRSSPPQTVGDHQTATCTAISFWNARNKMSFWSGIPEREWQWGLVLAWCSQSLGVSGLCCCEFPKFAGSNSQDCLPSTSTLKFSTKYR